MPGLTGTTSQAPRVNGLLNTVNDAQAGVIQAAQTGYITPTYPGQVGVKIYLDAADALKLSDTTIGTLLQGTYMYVATNAAAANVAKGRLAFWDTTTLVTNPYQAHQLESQNGGLPLIAGVFLNSITAGNFGFIQVAGRATCLCRAAVTAATRHIVWSNAGAGADNATVDGLAAATAVTFLLLESYLGLSEAVAANATQIIVNLNGFCVNHQ